MKLSFALLALFAAFGTHQVHSVPVLSRGLAQDVEDFVALIPIKKITELFYEYLEGDEDFGEAIDYMLSDDFKSLVTTVEGMPEVKTLMTYLQQAGLDVYEMVNKLHDLLGIDHINPLRQSRISGGLPGFIKDVEALLPIEKIQKLYQEKLQTSKPFAALIKKLKSPEFQALVDRVMANSELQKLIKYAESKGVDVKAIFDILNTLLGLKFPHRPYFSLTRNLNDDLNDFMKLVPVDEIKSLFYDYLSEDADFGEALDYVLSNEFKQLLTDIESMPEVRELLKFLVESGLDAYEFVNKINDLLGIDRISPKSSYKASKSITGGLPGFIEDVKALLPVDKIEALYKNKLETSKDFAKLVERLMSTQFQGLIDKIMANPKMQDLMKRAEAKGVDVQAILDFITSILGIKFPERPYLFMTRNLLDDLSDFLSLLPFEEITNLIYQYLSEDQDFGQALDYFGSDDFKNMLAAVEQTSEVKNVIDFLEESGLEAYNIINMVNYFLGIDRIHPLNNFKFQKITGGLPGFIKDLKALLPLDKIKALYNEKLQSSADFKNLITRLKSKEFQGVIDKLLANPSVQDLIKRTKAKGIDIQAVFDLFTEMFGLKFTQRQQVFSRFTRDLNDDLNDFLALVPVDKIQDLFYEYLSSDDDFGAAMDYILSDEFKNLVKEVEGFKEVKGLLKFLVASGLDAYGFVNQINDYLGIDHIDATLLVKSRKITGGLPGFMEDVKALLPLDKIEALYKEKLQTSADFKNLITRLKSKEFQGLVDKLLANPSLQNLIKKVEAKGVDVQAIFDFFTTLLGLKFPPRPQMDKLDVDWEEVDKIIKTVIGIKFPPRP